MSNEFQLIRKAQRGFDAIADAVLDDVYDEDLLFDNEGNAYILVDEEDIEKGIPKAIQARGTGGEYGVARRKAWRTGHQASRLNSGAEDEFDRAVVDWRKARGAKARQAARDIANGAKVEKGLPSVQRAMLRAAEKTGDHSAINEHWAHSLKINNKRIGQEVAGKPQTYLHGGRTTDPARIARLKEIGTENAGRRKEYANRNGGKIGLGPSKANPGMNLKESTGALASQREAALRARRPVQIRGGEVNKPAW